MGNAIGFQAVPQLQQSLRTEGSECVISLDTCPPLPPSSSPSPPSPSPSPSPSPPFPFPSPFSSSPLSLLPLLPIAPLLPVAAVLWNSVGKSDVEYSTLLKALESCKSVISDIKEGHTIQCETIAIKGPMRSVVDDDLVISLIKLLVTNKTVKVLNFKKCIKLTDKAALEILKILKPNRTIESINLAESGISQSLQTKITAARTREVRSPIIVLSLDGGGIRGISEVAMLKHIVELVGGSDRKLPEMFDLVAGTSTGGIIALGLKQYHAQGLTLSQSLDELHLLYKEFGKQVFHTSLIGYVKSLYRFIMYNGWYDTGILEGLLKKYLYNADAKLAPDNDGDPTTRAFVVSSTISEANRSAAILLQDYLQNGASESNSLVNKRITDCSTWEAVRATSAAPAYFSPITLDEIPLQDGGVGYNNPTRIAYYEAINLWEDRDIVVISLGTGLWSEEQETTIGKIGRVLKIRRFGELLLQMATDTSRVDLNMAAESLRKDKKQNLKYLRFNVFGIGNIALDDWQQMDKVEADTLKYLKTNSVAKYHLKQLEEIFKSKFQKAEEKTGAS